ncbi:hypothetical protein IMCC3317_26090 [Kordia antarctica]|uniref:Chromosome partition protein Smc n=1 Tax=Kordia antarctica TaxID=1218801 RepID=A0A7L4ZL35_9FLAO|nr:hypothetical protein [Kordia antarctica]QHI37231.1 hypothetical protein IMCC3317_26090 [Kordia antarctica]
MSRETILIAADPAPQKYGITEKKKQEIDFLTQEVLNAQNEVQQYQAIVTSLTEKSTKLETELSTAEANKTQALNNKNSVDTVVNNAKDLYASSGKTLKESSGAETDIKGVATEINTVINKLIYSAEVINKLSNLVIRKKAINPLISDELITMVTQASSDANNAVALTLIALESVFSSQATTIESKAAMELEESQSKKLYEFIVGAGGNEKTSLEGYLSQAYDITSNMYEESLAASNDTVGQLDDAQVSLSKAQVKLSSLQAGLAAANAAALAS